MMKDSIEVRATDKTYECRYDERLNTKVEECPRLTYVGLFIMNR
jgi:hypothetical protein